jgi:hypothetical protein
MTAPEHQAADEPPERARLVGTNGVPKPAGGGRGAARRVDPSGKHALFSAPPSAARDQLGPGNQKDGREAFFSTGPRQPGTAIVICSACETRARITLVDVGVRLASISLWNPLRKHSHWMRCPGCHRHQWCQIAWSD